jgi:hypothetical protein
MMSIICTAYMVLIIYKCANVYAFVNFIGGPMNIHIVIFHEIFMCFYF